MITAPRSSLQIINLRRRAFLAAVPAAGLALAVGLPRFARAEEVAYGADSMPHGWVDHPLVFVNLSADGTVTVTCHRSEMGQGVRTSMAMVIADELDADWGRVKVVQAPGDEVRYGNQDTDGSRSLRHFFEPMRRCGAAARMMLEAAAASQWNVPAEQVEARNHEVLHRPTGRRLGFGTLSEAAALLPVPQGDTLRFKPPSRYRYIGNDQVNLLDGADMATGRAQYGIDTRLDGMMHAVIARPPVYGGNLVSFDPSAALQVPGVIRVVEIPGTPPPSEFQPLGGVAVIASNTWAAIKGREALKLEWRDGPHADYDSNTYRATMERAARAPGAVVRDQGDLESDMARAARRLEAEYYIPHLTHASMEPLSATARITGGRCELWAPTQAPQAARERVAQRLGMPMDHVSLNVTLLGGGFGRKSKADFIIEAALLSKAMDGAPVKVTWTREDDVRHSYYHTASLERLEAGLDAGGRPLAWRHSSVAPTIGSTFGPDPKHQQPFELGMGLVNVPFDIPSIRIENPEAEAHTRIGWYRSVSNIPHAFAIQSFVDELAAAAGRDPKDYLLELIGPPRRIDPRTLNDTWNHSESPQRYPLDTGRLRGVVEAVARASGWGAKLPAGQGLGIAAHYSFLTYVAVVMRASVSDAGALSIPRVDIAVDCGPQINPDRIRSQMEGACIMGLSNALLSQITFQRGRVEQSNFHDYRIARISDAPRDIRVHLVTAAPDTPLGGVGEPGVPPIAPALCNAIFAATGKRIRRLPIGDQLLSAA